MTLLHTLVELCAANKAKTGTLTAMITGTAAAAAAAEQQQQEEEGEVESDEDTDQDSSGEMGIVGKPNQPQIGRAHV